LRLAPPDGDHARAVNNFSQAHEHHSDGAQADHRQRVARAQGAVFQSVQHAGQRFGQRRVLITHMALDHVQVLLNNALRNADVLGVSAVVEHQILTQVFLVTAAAITFPARSRVGGHHALANLKTLNVLAHRDNVARQLMAE
jgi:hypothetical protein